MSHSKGSRRFRTDGGFTLIEVLVALAIVAIALVAALKATSSLAETTDALHRRLLASFSAQNRLAEIRLGREWPSIGTRDYPCPQGPLDLVCEDDVEATPNPLFRRIVVHVKDATRADAELAQLIGIIPNETVRPL